MNKVVAATAATVVIIGVIGFALDLICAQAIRRASWIREE